MRWTVTTDTTTASMKKNIHKTASKYCKLFMNNWWVKNHANNFFANARIDPNITIFSAFFHTGRIISKADQSWICFINLEGVSLFTYHFSPLILDQFNIQICFLIVYLLFCLPSVLLKRKNHNNTLNYWHFYYFYEQCNNSFNQNIVKKMMIVAIYIYIYLYISIYNIHQYKSIYIYLLN